MANSLDPDQTAPIRAVCSGSTLFASMLNSSVMSGNYLQQTTSADGIFRCIFFHGALRFKLKKTNKYCNLGSDCFPLGSLFVCTFFFLSEFSRLKSQP